jgi:hypothetical protein
MLPHPRVPRSLHRPLRFALGVVGLVGDMLDMLRDSLRPRPAIETFSPPCSRTCLCDRCVHLGRC